MQSVAVDVKSCEFESS